jgi:methylglutaconyl-CoA hydratase
MDEDGSELLGGNRIRVIRRGCVREIQLNRADSHNALDEELVDGLSSVFRALGREASDPASSRALRGVVLSGAGKSFCAGADLNYMRRIAANTEEENRDDARRLSGMFAAVRGCPVFVLARVHGSALGGGAGLAACWDLVIASDEARFGFTEVRLGIVPAVISPFVIERIGPARARGLFTTGEIIDALEARNIGLVDRVVPAAELDEAVERILQALLRAAPLASREAKALIERVNAGLPLAPERTGEGSLFEATSRTIARLRSAPEGREGIASFLEKRRPWWDETR